jgi:hypothetical protein
MRNLLIGVAIGYFFSDEIENFLHGTKAQVTYNRTGTTDYANTKLSTRREAELDDATVENPAKVTVEEARALAERKNVSLHSVLSSGRWLISEEEA